MSLLGDLALLSVAAALASCGTASPQLAAPTLLVTLAHQSAGEIATRDQLERLQRAHDLSPWFFTQRIVIDEESIPHSHPVLTLHARHQDSDDALLSTFIHEEIHWFLADRDEALARAVDQLRAELPGLPVGFPDGADSEQSSYEHLIVILGERDGLVSLIGEARAAAVFAFWEGDHYRALYRVLREHRDIVLRVARANDLVLRDQ